MMNQMMEETLLTGTAHKAELPGWQAAGKTGTSQDWRDAWFVGYTCYLVAGVWLGNDDGTPTKKVSGGNLPVEIWSRFMKAAHQGVPVAGLPLGDWRDADAPAFEPAPPPPPLPIPEAAGAPLTINKGGEAALGAPVRRAGQARGHARRLERAGPAGVDPQRSGGSAGAARATRTCSASCSERLSGLKSGRLGHRRNKQKRGKNHQMHRALQDAGAPGSERQRADVERQGEQRHVRRRNAKRDLAFEQDRDQRNGRDRQANARDRGTERKIDAVLQPILHR